MAPGTVAQPKAINQKKTGATHFQPGLLDLPAVTGILAEPLGQRNAEFGRKHGRPRPTRLASELRPRLPMFLCLIR